MIVWSGWSLLGTKVGSRVIPRPAAVASAFSKVWPTNDGRVTVPGPGLTAGVSVERRRKTRKPTMTRMRRPRMPATHVQTLVPRRSSGARRGPAPG
jgi:hypothetical protein